MNKFFKYVGYSFLALVVVALVLKGLAHITIAQDSTLTNPWTLIIYFGLLAGFIFLVCLGIRWGFKLLDGWFVPKKSEKKLKKKKK